MNALKSESMGTALIAYLLAFGAIGCSSGRTIGLEPAKQKADQIIVVKSTHTMTLMEKGQILKVYKIAIGRGPKGPKDHEGDHKTPEGEYLIDQKNSKSRFHLALHVSYPNAADRKRAQDEGLDPGGAIMIHGVEDCFSWLGPLLRHVDWTDGCIAVTNSEIEEIWRLVPVGTSVAIRP
jgi:murein L,D-transpeptidase YafK